MKLDRCLLVALLLVAAISVVEGVTQAAKPSDPCVDPVAQEFRKRLGYYEGSLSSMSLSQGVLTAR